jgi:hypothetical protein
MNIGPISRPRALVALVLVALAAVLVSASPAFAATFTVTNTENEGAGSLRRAIEEVNAAGSGNTIAFDIPGSGPFTIAPTSALPLIQSANTKVDGCTQPGADCSGLPLTLEIRLAGEGFLLGADGITIRGFALTDAGTGVTLARVAENSVFRLEQNVTIEDNYVGLAPDGSAAGKNAAFQLQTGLRGLSINGLRILDNVIGSNKSANAIELATTGFGTVLPVSGLRIEGNIIGLDPTGTQPRPNAGGGILVEESGGANNNVNTISDNKRGN